MCLHCSSCSSGMHEIVQRISHYLIASPVCFEWCPLCFCVVWPPRLPPPVSHMWIHELRNALIFDGFPMGLSRLRNTSKVSCRITMIFPGIPWMFQSVVVVQVCWHIQFTSGSAVQNKFPKHALTCRFLAVLISMSTSKVLVVHRQLFAHAKAHDALSLWCKIWVCQCRPS